MLIYIILFITTVVLCLIFDNSNGSSNYTPVKQTTRTEEEIHNINKMQEYNFWRNFDK